MKNKSSEGKGIKINKLINEGKTYREILKETGIKSLSTINYYAKRIGGKKVFLCKEEIDTMKEVVIGLWDFQDDSETYRITNSIIGKLYETSRERGTLDLDLPSLLVGK